MSREKFANNTEQNSVSRRRFISMAGVAASTLAISPRFAFTGEPTSERRVRVGIVGGRFGASFYFHEHPNCTVEAVSDLIPARRQHLMDVYSCSKSYESLKRMLRDTKIEAVFVATPAPDHAKHVIACLNAGKHVLCAVPAAMSLEECNEVRNTVKRTGLTYMMAETSMYRQGMITVKKLFKEGQFGEIFSAAAEYNHPGLETYFFEEGKPTWRHGMPPMLYPTHSTSFLIGVTGERLTEVSCLGWGDDSPLLKDNPYDNPFWNQSAFFKTNRNTPFRVEVNWKGALQEAERGEWRGSKMSFYYPQAGAPHFTTVRVDDVLDKDDAGFQHAKNITERYVVPEWWNTDMLPKALRHSSGHEGSHTFITHDFIDSIVNSREPEVNIYEALAYTAPGIVAHQSSLKNGETMAIPNFD